MVLIGQPLYTFSDEYFLENTAFAFDGESLYFLAVNVDTGLTEIGLFGNKYWCIFFTFRIRAQFFISPIGNNFRWIGITTDYFFG